MVATIRKYPLVIIGNGGFGREVLELIRDHNAYNEENFQKSQTYDSSFYIFEVLGFLNNDKDSWNTICNGIKILGDESWIQSYLDSNGGAIGVAIGIGTPKIKRKIVENLTNQYGSGVFGVHFPNIIHPSVIQGRSITYGIGNIITAGNILTCNIEIKNHVMINLACTVGHDVIIDDYAVVSPGVNISGNVNIGEEAYLGTGSTILEKKNIGKRSVVGGQALVSKDVPDDITVVGVPAKPLLKG